MAGRNGKTHVDRTTKAFFYLCVTFCVSFLVWASVAPLDIVSDAIGEVVPSSKVKRIQHLEGGIVREIKVREGDVVEVGQALIDLEATASDSTVEEIIVRVTSLRTEIARLEAEAKWFVDPKDETKSTIDPHDAPLVFSADLEEGSPDLVKQARELYDARRERLINEVSAQREKIKQREQDVKEISARIRNQIQSLKYVREQIKISEELLKDKLTTRYKHLGFLKEESELLSKIQEDEAALDRSKSMLVAERDKLEQISIAFNEEVQEDLRRARREFLEFSQRLRKTSDSLDRTVIRSPAKGIVKSIYIMGEGEVVQPGMTVLDIVPAGDKLVIEAHLALGDIGYVDVGQPANVKLATGDARMFGSLEGVVKHISPDAITTPENETYYRVLVETESDRFEKNELRYQLYPGMRLLVSIKTGERTVLEYLIYPYFDTLYHGMQER